MYYHRLAKELEKQEHRQEMLRFFGAGAVVLGMGVGVLAVVASVYILTVLFF